MKVIEMDTIKRAEHRIEGYLDVDDLNYVSNSRDSNQFRTSDNHIIVIAWRSYMNGSFVGTTATYQSSGENGKSGHLAILSGGYTPLDSTQIVDALNKVNLI